MVGLNDLNGLSNRNGSMIDSKMKQEEEWVQRFVSAWLRGHSWDVGHEQHTQVRQPGGSSLGKAADVDMPTYIFVEGIWMHKQLHE